MVRIIGLVQRNIRLAASGIASALSCCALSNCSVKGTELRKASSSAAHMSLIPGISDQQLQMRPERSRGQQDGPKAQPDGKILAQVQQVCRSQTSCQL